MKHRLLRLRKFMEQHDIQAILITKPENRRYFSGFSGSAGMLLISHDTQSLITDFRYIEQATIETNEFDIVRYTTNPYTIVEEITKKMDCTHIGFESDFTTYDTYTKLTDVMPACHWLPVQIDQLRMLKDADEVASITKAVDIADRAFSHIVSFIQPGLTEQAVALELEYQMGKLGSEKPAFDTIMASGKRGALPHGKASNKIIEAGDLVTMDFGAVYQGYHSDITRTICMGPASPRQREIYEVVLKAQLAGVQALTPGKTGQDIDAVARKVIVDAGFGEYFGHGLGHSLGLAIHEDPRLSMTNAQTVIRENMVVTVEPGIYLPDWGGVRIEDTVLVRADGCQILTTSSKELIEIV